MSKNVRGSNSIPSGIVDDADIRKQATLAFQDSAKAESLAGSAVQRLAYAVTAEHFTMVQAGKGLPPIEATLPGADAAASAGALKTIRNAMEEFFITALGDKPEGKSDKFEALKAVYTAQMQLLSRAIQLAAIFAKARVTLDAFNATTGTFMVPSNLLLGKDETAFGKLAQAKTIALDGGPILVVGKEDNAISVRASVTRLVKLNTVRKERVSRTPDAVGLNKYASEVARILNDPTATIEFDKLESDLKNSIAAIVQWWDAQQEAANKGKGKAA